MGVAWVNDILGGNCVRCYEMSKMELLVFQELCFELQLHGFIESREMGVHEMVGIFLNTVGHAIGNSLQLERF